jgi:hypothetical protein
VTDAAILPGVEVPAPIPTIRQLRRSPPPGRNYTPFLKRGGLKGARIEFRGRSITMEGAARWPQRRAEKGTAEAIAILQQQAQSLWIRRHPSAVSDPKHNLIEWNTCSGAAKKKALMTTARRCSSTA